jgi:hypothetical protein
MRGSSRPPAPPARFRQRRHGPEYRPARLEHPARSQALQANRVIPDTVGQAGDRGDRHRVVARHAGRPPVRVARGPRPVLEFVVPDVVERLDNRPRDPPGHDLAASAVFEGLQHALGGRPVVHRVDHELAVEQARIDLAEAVQRDREHHDVCLSQGVAGPPGRAPGIISSVISARLSGSPDVAMATR